MTARLKVAFWGVRGTRPTPRRENLRYGGDTACVEIAAPSGERLLLDAGTGIVRAGATFAPDAPVHLFLSHYHRDHIDGLPFFAPLYQPGRTVTIHGPSANGQPEAILRAAMAPPYFPVAFDSTGAHKLFHEAGIAPVEAGPFLVRSFPLNHPQGSIGYRIEAGGAAVVYATDYEHGVESFDRTLREYAQGADLLISDAQFTPRDYEPHRGWGHTTWREAARLAADCGVKRLVLFHHDPTRDDDAIDAIVEEARSECSGTIAARQDLEMWV